MNYEKIDEYDNVVMQKGDWVDREKKIYQLGNIETLQLKIHKSMCEYCTKYEIQSNLNDSMMENYFITTDKQQRIDVSEIIKINIISKLH